MTPDPPDTAPLLRPAPIAKGDAIGIVAPSYAPRPGWLLRGVVMGKAALEPDNQDADLAMWEFFTNLVVRRGPEPAAPGSVLHMEIPQLDEQ